jgi:hypothetical protein
VVVVVARPAEGAVVVVARPAGAKVVAVIEFI